MATHISIIAALGKNRELGLDGKLLWRIPDDLKRFKALTIGHPVIMGRKTFESIGKLLPGRTNIVITRSSTSLGANDPQVVVVNSIEEALKKAKALDQKEIFIIGGASIYRSALPVADRLYLTLIDDEKPADTYFPAYEEIFTKKLEDVPYEWRGIKYRWVILEK